MMVVVLMDSSRVSMLHPPLTCGGLRLPLCVAMIRHPFTACGTGRVKKARFIGRFNQDQPHHVTKELQRAPPSCDSQSVYMNELTKMQNNKMMKRNAQHFVSKSMVSIYKVHAFLYSAPFFLKVMMQILLVRSHVVTNEILKSVSRPSTVAPTGRAF